MIKLITLLTIIIFSFQTMAKDEPAIVTQGDVKTVVMNKEIKKVLRKWDSEATVLEAQNFSDKVWALYTSKDPNSLPMATVGDFNGDKIKDLGLLVKTGNTIKAIVALSKNNTYTYSIHEVRKFPLNTAEIRKDKRVGPLQVKVYLFTEGRKHLKHQKGMAPRDGFQVEQLFSADTTVHYAVDQKFREYKGLVK